MAKLQTARNGEQTVQHPTFLRNKLTGVVFLFTAALSKQKTIEPLSDEEALEFIEQTKNAMNGGFSINEAPLVSGETVVGERVMSDEEIQAREAFFAEKEAFAKQVADFEKEKSNHKKAAKKSAKKAEEPESSEKTAD